VREGYRFVGWARSRTGAVVSSFSITEDTTLYAQWQEDAGTATSFKPEDDGPAPEGANPAVVGVSGLDSSDLALMGTQSGNILADIAAGTVPLGNLQVIGAWSLLSLTLAVLALISALILLFSGFVPRRRKVDEGEDSEATTPGRYLTLKVIALIAGALVAVVWVIFDDISRPMVWINSWTIFVAALFVIHLVVMTAYIVVRRRALEPSALEGSY
jgi:uncharacterized repeat protein (TIGR02543 family)